MVSLRSIRFDTVQPHGLLYALPEEPNGLLYAFKLP